MPEHRKSYRSHGNYGAEEYNYDVLARGINVATSSVAWEVTSGDVADRGC